MNAMGDFERDGWCIVQHSAAVLDWAHAAYSHALIATQDPDKRREWLRHNGTWFVGVDALENAGDGSISGVPLPTEGIADQVSLPASWHRAQVSVVYEGYPRQSAQDTDVAHRFRVNRCSAHVDGLLGEGDPLERHLREPHDFILGLPLNDVSACPLVVWDGSHRIMRAAFAETFDGVPPETWGDLDVSAPYKAARKQCFDTLTPRQVVVRPGEMTLVDRHLLHGVAPMQDGETIPPEGRMIAYFRPEVADISDWLG